MTVNPLANTAEPSGFRKFIRADKTQRVLLIVSFMFVPLVLLLMFTYIPFGKMVQFSFYNRNYLSEGTWVGLACAMAIVLLVIIILCTVAQKIFFKYFFKDNEEDAIMKEEDRRRQQLKERKKAARAARKAAKEAARCTINGNHISGRSGKARSAHRRQDLHLPEVLPAHPFLDHRADPGVGVRAHGVQDHR